MFYSPPGDAVHYAPVAHHSDLGSRPGSATPYPVGPMIENRDRLATTPARRVALDCVEAGIEAGHPRAVVRDAISLDGETLRVQGTTYDLTTVDDVVVLGGGNAAAHVAAALERRLGDRVDGGVVVTDDPADTERVTVHRGDHPVPSERGVEGAQAVLEAADAADDRTLVLAVVTGGGSALLPAPAGAVSLSDLQTTTDALLESGAAIDEINAVRKHLSALKGGRLARRLAPATVATLVLSDVVGNDLSVIASGPTAPDESTFSDALAVLDRCGIEPPPAVSTHLERGVDGAVPETPGPSHPAFDAVSHHVLADGMTVLEAASEAAAERGYEPVILSSRVRGEARAAATSHVAIAEETLATGQPVDPPAVFLSGGETTVTVRGNGRGGPNQEFAAGAALALDGGITVAAVDTDGIDGGTDAAGALVDETTVASPTAPTGADRSDAAAGRRALAENDVYPYLDARDALLRTGPTGTNLNDLRVVVVERS